MNGLGSGKNGELTFLDFITLLSFYIGTLNFQENLTQGDKQDLQNTFSEKADLLLSEIHNHLAEQDKRLAKILEILEVKQ